MNKQEPEGDGAGAFTPSSLLKETCQVKIISFFFFSSQTGYKSRHGLTRRRDTALRGF